jgi:predicted DNA-binding protein YlxM (UPF0122 family)
MHRGKKDEQKGGYVVDFIGDKDVMEKVKHHFKSNCSVRRAKHTRKSYVFSFSSKPVFNTLLTLGFTPRKSLTLQYPKIPNDYESTRHFFRGVFDGDGCITANRTKRMVKLNASVVSCSRKFILELHHLLNKHNVPHLGPYSRKPKNERFAMAYTISFNQKASERLYHFMYDDVPEELLGERKKKRFEEIMAGRARTPPHEQWWTVEEDNFIKAHFGRDLSVNLIANRINRSVKAVYHEAEKLGLQTRRFWTDDEDTFIRNNFNKMRKSEIAKWLKRTPVAVGHRALQLGLRKMIFWDDKEERFLKQHYGKDLNAIEIAQRLRKSAGAVRYKAMVMRLVKK